MRFNHTSVIDGEVRGYPCSGPITSYFGATDIAEHSQGHSGVDIGAPNRTPVLAPASGRVKDVFSLAVVGAPWAQSWKAVFGNSVIIDDGEHVTLLGHMADPPVVHEGQNVQPGDLLGYEGSTGESTGPHLHWGMAPSSNAYLQRDGLGGLLNVLDFIGDAVPEPIQLPVNTNITPGPWDVGAGRIPEEQIIEIASREHKRNAGDINAALDAVRRGYNG